MGCGSSKEVDTADSGAQARPAASNQNKPTATTTVANVATNSSQPQGGYEMQNKSTTKAQDPPNPIVYFDISQAGEQNVFFHKFPGLDSVMHNLTCLSVH